MPRTGGSTGRDGGPAATGALEELDGEALLQAFRRTRSPEFLEQLITAYTPMVQRIASGFLGSRIPLDDLSQVGYVGLLKAIGRYDSDRGTRFSVLARHFISGEIRHHVRDHRDLVRTPRWVRPLAYRLEAAARTLVAETGTFATLPQLVSATDLQPESILEVLRARALLHTRSLSGGGDAGEGPVDPPVEPQAANEALPAEERLALFAAIGTLSPLQRRVLYHLFFEDLSQEETGRRLGISQKHVSRVLASALRQLRGWLGGEAGGRVGPVEG